LIQIKPDRWPRGANALMPSLRSPLFVDMSFPDVAVIVLPCREVSRLEAGR
jgi:hypothetical protein